MNEHSLFPETEVEIATLIERIHNLGGRVMGVQEWRSLFSAIRQLLPHKHKLLLEPSQLDLVRYSASTEGRSYWPAQFLFIPRNLQK